jgi:hypothetical protein
MELGQAHGLVCDAQSSQMSVTSTLLDEAHEEIIPRFFYTLLTEVHLLPYTSLVVCSSPP